MATALIGLGANLGQKADQLQKALGRIANSAEVDLIRASQFHESLAVGGPADQPPFLNAAALLETSLPPRKLLTLLLEIEKQLGRQRHERWSARTIDLDLLLYDSVICGPLVANQPADLRLPHPRLGFRPFVLNPAAEIAAELAVPLTGQTVGMLQTHAQKSARHVAVCAFASVDTEKIVREAADCSNSFFWQTTADSSREPPMASPVSQFLEKENATDAAGWADAAAIELCEQFCKAEQQANPTAKEHVVVSLLQNPKWQTGEALAAPPSQESATRVCASRRPRLMVLLVGKEIADQYEKPFQQLAASLAKQVGAPWLALQVDDEKTCIDEIAAAALAAR